jgi:hypothetical protein
MTVSEARRVEYFACPALWAGMDHALPYGPFGLMSLYLTTRLIDRHEYTRPVVSILMCVRQRDIFEQAVSGAGRQATSRWSHR